MDNASNFSGRSEDPPVAAELWMSGKALRRPALAEDAKLLITDSTSVISDESVLITASIDRMCALKSLSLFRGKGSPQRPMARSKSLQDWRADLEWHTYSACALALGCPREHLLNRARSASLSQIAINNPGVQSTTWTLEGVVDLDFCSAFLWMNQRSQGLEAKGNGLV